VLTVRTEIPKSAPCVASICPVIPGAVLYERELQEMFGIVVDGIPDGRRLNLPDDWPDGQYPLRKDWKHVRPEEIIPGGKS
jgi:Ni,Fe-hydrogenase III component G